MVFTIEFTNHPTKPHKLTHIESGCVWTFFSRIELGLALTEFAKDIETL